MRTGIDVGSYYLKIACLDENGQLLHTLFKPHSGKPGELITSSTIQKLVHPGAGVTGALGHLVLTEKFVPVDEVQSLITGTWHLAGPFENLIYLGASSISLIRVNYRGELLDLRTNSMCAAGTGSFLDQQAQRMGVNFEETGRFASTDNPPSIAARCSVFAKSDLIHRQQEGYSVPELWCGLCRGLSLTIAGTLLRGERLRGRTVVVGGVALNREVVKYLKEKIPELIVPEHPHVAAATGAALLAENPDARSTATRPAVYFHQTGGREKHQRPPLVLHLSRIPEDTVFRSYVDTEGNEVRIIRPLQKSEPVALGMDVGSTSTKLALLTPEGEIIVDIYRRTAGDPIGAMKKLLKAVETIQEEENTSFCVLACGTTGSGRKLVGAIMGADRVVNEITAHARGARMLFGDDIETIFEIGGQDSKYIHMKQGRVDNVNMNYVCAAGTGSFVEEQAAKLGIRVQEIGDLVMGVSPPHTSERCTVFMEQDVEKLLREGASREEVIAAVLYSVCVNYLTKVVGNRPITGKRILFQGATARNKGLVAAFENLLNREILTSPFCHVTGAIGAALLALEETKRENTETSFRGWSIHRKHIEVNYSHCDLCANNCKITFARIEGVKEVPSWGYMCGRDPEDSGRKHNRHYEPFELRTSLFLRAGVQKIRKRRKEKIVIPRALSTYAFLPLWRAFFSHLGFPLTLTRPTDRHIAEKGVDASSADFCYPVKVFIGHALEAAEKGDYVFIPHVIAGEKPRYTVNSAFCPYVQAGPSIVRASESVAEALKDKLLAPVIDFARPDWLNVADLAKALEPLGINQFQVARAWKKGLEVLQAYREQCLMEGRRILKEVNEKGEKAVVVVGRYYNMYDSGINLDLPRKLSELGFTVIPYEYLPFDEKDLGEFFQGMFWYYGQRIINAAKLVKKHDNLFLLYLTNFSCGPDSFLLTYVEEILGRKPYLILELDEHGADAGYGTRLEAFADVVKEWEKEKEEKNYIYVKPRSDDFRSRLILIPPMHPSGAAMFAAAFRKHGYRAEVLPPVTIDQFEKGRSLTRGSECLPTQVTTGNIVTYIEKCGLEPHEIAVFMPTSDGPCRFGQYSVLQRIILNKLGYEDVLILSPSGQNTYLGLEGALRKDLWRGILIGDILFKAYCHTAPCEVEKGRARLLFETLTQEASDAFARGEEFTDIIRTVVRRFEKLPQQQKNVPLVGIVGEIFVRCNPYSCDYVVDWIIEAGAEPWLAPVSEWILYTTYIYKYKARKYMNLKDIFASHLRNNFLHQVEHRAYQAAGEFLAGRHEPPMEQIVEAGKRYFPVDFTGEAIITVGRAVLFIEQGASLVVNASPFTCMPGTTTSAVFRKISTETGVPVVNMFYDGSLGVNEKVAVFLRNLKRTLEEKQYQKSFLSA